MSAYIMAKKAKMKKKEREMNAVNSILFKYDPYRSFNYTLQ